MSRLARLALMLLAPLVLTVVVVPSAAAAKPVIKFTEGPGTGAPPDTLGILLVTPFPEDDREPGQDVTTVGPLQFSTSAIHHKIGDGWATWSHGYTGDVYETDGLTVTLPKRTSGFYFYAEPNEYATINITARTDNGTTSKDIAVDGLGGARFFGFYSRLPLTDFIKSVTISSDSRFALGEFGLQGDVAKYVAMGDSFSSGEGTGNYYASTDTVENRCHRSPDAYGRLLSSDSKSLKPFRSVACSGSVTSDLGAANHRFPGEPAQYEALSALTNAVSLTIGGNDVGFADVVDACIKARSHIDGRGCAERPEVSSVVQARLQTLDGVGTATAPDGAKITSLAGVLENIHSRSPKAKVYIAGYPELFGDDKSDFRKDATSPSGYVCDVNKLSAASLDYEDVQWINKKTRELNDVVKRAVSKAKAKDATIKAYYVSPSTFNGHGLCDSKKRWINTVIVTLDAEKFVDPASLHPTAEGQKSGYKKAFEKAGL